MNSKSTACFWCGIGFAAALVITFSIFDIFPGVRFSDAGWEAVPKALGVLGLLALLIERLIEIIVAPCRHPETNRLKEAVKRALAPEVAAGARQALLQTQGTLADFKAQTHRWALLIGFGFSLLASTAGVRLVEPLLDTRELQREEVAYRAAAMNVSRAANAERTQEARFYSAWRQALSQLGPGDITLVASNRVYEMTPTAMSNFTARFPNLTSLKPALEAREQWGSMSTALAGAKAEQARLVNERRSHLQLWWLRLMDVLLTAAAMTGGSEPIHKLFTWWQDASERRRTQAQAAGP